MNGVPELAGVSVVLEGWPDATETTLQCAWNEDTMTEHIARPYF